MRRTYTRFSELLLVDCSHKTNRYNYQLLTFMAMNEFGEGAVVQQTLIEANGDWHMERAIAHFKKLHPTRIDMLRVIVVDKNLNEIRVLESNFPEARILICHFHVIKYLEEMRAKPEFRKISGNDASQLDAAIHSMVYARSEDDYKVSHESLEGLCTRIGLQEFFNYFERNWDTCQERWVMYRRNGLPHFKNHTNNRLKSFFGKLKGSVDSSKSMAECIKALVASDRRVQNEYQYRLTRIGQFVNSNYDEEMATILRFTTHFVASQVETQYARALEKCNSYCFTDDPDADGVVLVGGKFSEHKLCLDNWQCNYDFAMSMKLPCRHAIAYRKKKQVGGTLIPWNCIDERWTSCSRDLKNVKQFSYERFESSTMGTRRHDMRTHHERYREAVRATHLIANEMADIKDEAEFSEMLSFVLNQWRNIRQKKRTSLGASSEMKASVGVSISNEAIKRIKDEFDLSSSSDEDMTSAIESTEDEDGEHESSEESNPTSKSIKIRLNPKARKVGRPQKAKKKTVAGIKQDRKWYEAAESARKTAGEVTLKSLMDRMDRDKPSLAETQRRLSGILVKYSEAEPKVKRIKNPVLNLDPFFCFR